MRPPLPGMRSGGAIASGCPDPDPERPDREFGVDGVVFGVETTDVGIIDLSDKVAEIVVAEPDELVDGKFPDTVRTWIDRINEAIAGVPELNDGSAQWLTLAWEPGGAGRFGTLWIEHFDCLGFKFVFQVQIGADDLSHRLRDHLCARRKRAAHRRRSRGDRAALRGREVRRGRPGQPAVPFCSVRPGFALRIAHRLDGMSVSASAAVKPATEDSRFFWKARAVGPPSATRTSSPPRSRIRAVTT